MSVASAPILVVDDDHDILEMVELILACAGYGVLVAHNGREALSLMRDRRPLPGLVILDLMMPVMNGWRFREEQQRDPGLAAVPVVVLSGDGRVAEKARELGVAEYLQKPVEPACLLALARRYVDTGGSPDAPNLPR